MTEIVLRFAMPDPASRYHMPVILSPHGYSVWWSS
jgi:5-hydroxyisourate hydrolase